MVIAFWDGSSKGTKQMINYSTEKVNIIMVAAVEFNLMTNPRYNLMI